MSCPICSKKTEAAWRPFCSKRCADIDLARWLGEGYRIESGADAGDDAIATSTADEAPFKRQ